MTRYALPLVLDVPLPPSMRANASEAKGGALAALAEAIQSSGYAGVLQDCRLPLSATFEYHYCQRAPNGSWRTRDSHNMDSYLFDALARWLGPFNDRHFVERHAYVRNILPSEAEHCLITIDVSREPDWLASVPRRRAS